MVLLSDVLGYFRVDCSRLCIVVVFAIRVGCWLVRVVWFVYVMLFVGYLLSLSCPLVVICYVFFVVLLFVASCSLCVVCCSLFVVRLSMNVAYWLSFGLCCVLLVVCYVLVVVCRLLFRA